VNATRETDSTERAAVFTGNVDRQARAGSRRAVNGEWWRGRNDEDNIAWCGWFVEIAEKGKEKKRGKKKKKEKKRGDETRRDGPRRPNVHVNIFILLLFFNFLIVLFFINR
jgi:hypothetical protein